ncbi:GAF domain-containing protein [Paraburkholderia saeva]|uniref:GAF domain-containing protein n=1 Tax=Paraburkholderia saeva TaxID=2777537 RepID=UPI001D3DB028|nr:GAF domain-containing protein [Paraburkholderia saeva]CAG4892992.1 Free methionine-R-sulfoxide reductase [Paraburkholderia saeva]
MFQGTVSTALPRREFYHELTEQARGLLAGETNLVANAANLSALLFNAMPDVNWAGFYFLVEGELVVGPFQGKPACVRIAMGRGVCGTAAQTRETQLVPDVHAFAGHIACDSASRSELVVPLVMPDGAVLGVLDIDSPLPARFTEEDRDGIEAIAAILVATLAPAGAVL